MAKQFREGSQGAADQKSGKTFMIGAAIALAIVFSLLYLNFPVNYMGRLENLSPWYATLGSLVLNAVACYMLWKAYEVGDLGKNPLRNSIIFLLLLAWGIMMACGFNFDLARLDR